MNCISLFFALLPFLFLSCKGLRNEVDPDRLNKESGKLVITSFISPQDTVIGVIVRRSNPVLATTAELNSNQLITNASVTLQNGDRLASLRFVANYNNTGTGLYFIETRNFPIVAGQTYKLTVLMPDGQKVDAQCTIPMAPPTFEVKLDSALVEDTFFRGGNGSVPYYRKDYTLRVNWIDPSAGRNYYRAAAQFRIQSRPPGSTTTVQPIGYRSVFFENTGLIADSPSTNGTTLTSRDANYYSISANPYSGAPVTISNADGTTTNYSCPICATFITGPSGVTTISPSVNLSPISATVDPSQITISKMLTLAELTISLLHTDENYYRYHDTAVRQGDSGGNPFAEPVPIPTNINGGLGCFAGYNRRTVVVKLK